MWIYEKKLQYPIRIQRMNPMMASWLMSQVGGPDGELNAALRYLNQRYTMPINEGKGLLTDIGTEELAHVEMVSAMVNQLMRCANEDDMTNGNMADYYVDHTVGVWPQASGGTAQSALQFQCKGDPITDLHENMAAEQKARTTYENLLRLADDPDVREPLKFLRAREIVHYQRFGELLRILQDRLDSRNFYAYNPAFDATSRCCSCPVTREATPTRCGCGCNATEPVYGRSTCNDANPCPTPCGFGNGCTESPPTCSPCTVERDSISTPCNDCGYTNCPRHCGCTEGCDSTIGYVEIRRENRATEYVRGCESNCERTTPDCGCNRPCGCDNGIL